jgi:hypothetical protein
MAGGSVALSGMELPPLPLEEWEDTKETLHRYCQIVGKIRMELAPFKNHWWHVTLYVTPRGLTTVLSLILPGPSTSPSTFSTTGWWSRPARAEGSGSR